MKRWCCGAVIALMAAGCEEKPALATDDAGVVATTALATIAATCAAATGSVQVKRPGSSYWEPLAVGGVLREGDWIRTGPTSAARVEFLGGGGLELDENALVIVERGAAPADSGITEDDLIVPLIAVAEGEVRGVAGGAGSPKSVSLKLADGSLVKIGSQETGSGVEFRITGKGGLSRLAITKGKATVVGKGGAQTAMKAGQEAALTSAGATDVAELLEFPESLSPGVDARFQLTSGLAVQLSWSKVKDAKGYRVQLARDLAFRELVGTYVVDGEKHSITPQTTGLYVWRVATRDARDRFGEYGFARRIFVDEPAPRLDVLRSPPHDATITITGKAAKVHFNWGEVPDAGEYTLVVATTPDLAGKPVAHGTTSDTEYDITGLSPGSYHWGVYVGTGQSSPAFTSPRHLTVKRGKSGVKTPKAIDDWGK